MITLLSTFRIRGASSATELRRRLLAMAPTVRTEPGNLGYGVYAAIDDPMTLFVLEAWQTQDDDDRHVRRVEDDGSVSRAADLLVEPIRTAQLTQLLPPDL